MTWKQLAILILQHYDPTEEARITIVHRDADNCLIGEVSGPVTRAGMRGLCVENQEMRTTFDQTRGVIR